MSNGTRPQPPYLGPLPTPSIPVAPVGKAMIFFVEYHPDTNSWGTGPFLPANWDQFPTGYYYPPFSTSEIPVIIVVYARTRPDGSVAPNVLEYPNWTVVNDTGGNVGNGLQPDPQPAPAPTENPDCPPGFILMEIATAIPLIDGAPQEYDTMTSICVPVGPAWPAWATNPPPPPPPPPPPTCPTGYHYDSAQEKCVPDNPTNPPPPTCPTGYHWDPSTEMCQPDNPPPPPPPPPNPGPCPPYVGQPDCLPTAPASDPDADEVGDGFAQLAYWLEVLATWAMNTFYALQAPSSSGQGNGTGNADPVTCTQLTQQVQLVNSGLQAIATAITNVVQPSATPIDLTAIVDQLKAIAQAIANAPAEQPVDLKPVVDAINGPQDTVAQAAALQGLIIDDPAFPPEAKQIFGR